MELIAASTEDILNDVTILKRVVDLLRGSQCYTDGIGWMAYVVIALQKRATSIVDGLDQTCVGDTHSGGSQTNNVAILLVQFPLRLNMSLSIVIEEAPDV